MWRWWPLRQRARCSPPAVAPAVSAAAAAQGSAGGTTITLLVDNADTTVASAKAVSRPPSRAANPGITVKMEPRPGGSDGDNLVKTRLSTGDMSEVFNYNNGSLSAALKPEQNSPRWTTSPGRASSTRPSPSPPRAATASCTAGRGAAPMGGAVLYNIPVYKKLGLEIPKTWDEFMKNNEAIKKAGGIDPVEQTYGETWTSQLFVLGDYHNVSKLRSRTSLRSTPPAKPSTPHTPAALAGFQHIQAGP